MGRFEDSRSDDDVHLWRYISGDIFYFDSLDITAAWYWSTRPFHAVNIIFSSPWPAHMQLHSYVIPLDEIRACYLDFECTPCLRLSELSVLYPHRVGLRV